MRYGGVGLLLVVACTVLLYGQSPAGYPPYRQPYDYLDSIAQDSLRRLDSVSYTDVSRDADGKLRIIRRGYEYRTQLGLALAMMAFVTVILTTTQSWNPD